MAKSPWQRIENNAIFRVPHRKKPIKPPEPTQLKTFSYTAMLTDSMWLRRRARRLHHG
ncbi:NinE family protein [Rouxiella badensis]|uniref:NinE family protein n=1 Tax=Rouxiella badensis TaxID=1646377 RepID=UPI0013EF492B|nr:NinE family protein [Rouxiella badensis]MCC3717956.1 NinE family protein [Rouxiella badensis]MCC3730029.1 NinE family protein [Rouxiella badensis]MCC3749732.1 NinE family protein [Rouxiella badensis]QII37870.1 NinE family protein [Rouxiella badensis]